MPKHSLVATAVTVRQMRSDPTDRLPVDDLDGNGLSLLDLFYGFVAHGITGGGWDDTKAELLVTPTDVSPIGRTVLMVHESGYYGSNGTIRQKASGATTYTFGTDEAPVVPKQSLFVVPVRGDYAVCLDQRIGLSALPKLFWREFRRAVRKHHGLLVDVAQSADAAAWEEFLDNADKLSQVTYIQEPDDIADGKSHAVPIGLRKYQVTKDREVDSLPLELLTWLRDRRSRANRTRADKMVMLPEGFGEPSEISVTVKTGSSERTVDVVSDQYPSFVYSFSSKGKEPTPDVFLSDARDVAVHLLEQNLDCDMGDASWRSAPWSDERRDQRLSAGGVDDDDVDPDNPLG